MIILNKDTAKTSYSSPEGDQMRKLSEMIANLSLQEFIAPQTDKLNNQLATGKEAQNNKAMANAANKATTTAAVTGAAATVKAGDAQAKGVVDAAGAAEPATTATATAPDTAAKPADTNVTVAADDIEDAVEQQIG